MRILVPTDISDFSLQAIEVALQIAQNREQVRVVHVMMVIEPVDPEMVWAVVDEPTRMEQTRAQLAGFLKQKGFGDISSEVLIGNAGAEIAEYARTIEAGLIVIPSHGRGPIKRLLLGSTTDRVVHLAHCPVLVLKDEKKSDAAK